MTPMIALFLLALALASDAFAVALCQGAVAGPRPWRQAQPEDGWLEKHKRGRAVDVFS